MRTSPTNIGLQLLATVSAYDLGFITLRRDGSTGWSARSARSSGCGGSAATSTTGTTCTTCACWSRRTSPRWTAATSPATSSRCGRRASRCRTQPVFDGRAWRALDAALALAERRGARSMPGDAAPPAPERGRAARATARGGRPDASRRDAGRAWREPLDQPGRGARRDWCRRLGRRRAGVDRGAAALRA